MLASAAGGHVRTEPRATAGRARRRFLAAAGTCCACAFAATMWLVLQGSAPAVPSTSPEVRVPGLLAAVDAGPGWTSTTVGALQAEPAGCFRPRAELMASSPRSAVAVLISAPAGLPTVDEVAARYATADRAVAAFDAAAADLRACRTFDTPAGIATVSPIRMAVNGASSAAARVVLGTGASTAGADFVAVQRGAAVAVLVYGTGGTPDQSTVSALAAKASERLGP